MAQIRVDLSELIRTLQPILQQGTTWRVSSIKADPCAPNYTLPTAVLYDAHLAGIRGLCKKMQGFILMDVERTIALVKEIQLADQKMSGWTRLMGEDISSG